MKLDYFKDCVIGTELKLDLFVNRNYNLMHNLTVNTLLGYIDSKAIVLRFFIKTTSCDKSIITLELLIDGEYKRVNFGIELPKQVEA